MRLGFEADAAPQFGAVVHDAVGDDEFNFADVVDGFERIGVHYDYVRALSDFHGAEFLVETHYSSRDNMAA